MELIVHAGMGKAGSTALQRRLRNAGAKLRDRGILYPGRDGSHNFLTAGFTEPDKLGRILAQRYGGDEAAIKRDFAVFWNEIKEQVRRAKPSTVILSAEHLWGGVRGAQAQMLRTLLSEIGDDIQIVCYVRRPSEWYLSAAQQLLKSSHVVSPVRPVRYRDALEALDDVGKIHVVHYDRKLFPGGDICADFANRFLPGAENALAATEDGIAANETMSAEAMAIVQDYRRAAHPDARNISTKDTTFLMRNLRELGNGARPVLRPEIGHWIDHASTDLLWLREKYGIVFDGIDYDAIGKVEPKVWATATVSDICFVDEQEKARLLYGTLQALLADRARRKVKLGAVYTPDPETEPDNKDRASGGRSKKRPLRALAERFWGRARKPS